jgi:hypothetical protein
VIELRAAAPQVAANEIGVHSFEIGRRDNGPGANGLAKSWSQRFDSSFDSIG